MVANEAGLRGRWSELREVGNSFMKLWLVWDLVLFNVLLILFLIAGAIAFADIRHFLVEGEYVFTRASGFALVFLVLAWMVSGVLLWLARSFMFQLVLPVMYIRRVTAKAAIGLAWREIFLPRKGLCIGFFLLHVVSGIVKGFCGQIGLLILALATACVACVAFLIPIIGNYPLALSVLPVTTFEAVFQLSFISQFGPEYRVPWALPTPGGFPVTQDDLPAPAPSP
jgi:hypothetical protein